MLCIRIPGVFRWMQGPAAAEETQGVVDSALEEQRLALQEDLEAYRASHFSEAEK